MLEGTQEPKGCHRLVTAVSTSPGLPGPCPLLQSALTKADWPAVTSNLVIDARPYIQSIN